jgi:hypothetical protein
MTHKPPPIPAEQQSPHSAETPKTDPRVKRATLPGNTKEQGQPGNIYQNTRNQGYQQDR